MESLRLDYFLPAILGGELPLDVAVTGARGAVDLERLLTGAAPGGRGPGAPASPRLRLGHVTLTDLELSASRAPFTLPDMTISDLSVRDQDDSLLLAATVATEDGALRARGELDLETLDFTGTVEHADVAIARHWWPGARGGVATGTLAVTRGRVTGDFTVTGGSVADLGLAATDLSGTARLAYPVIEAEVTGKREDGGRKLVDFSLVAHNQDGELSARGRATAELFHA